MKILITGGYGFIGSALIRHLLQASDHEVFNIDALTYAANRNSVPLSLKKERYKFYEINLCNFKEVKKAIDVIMPDAIIHLAAESHVDRSINDPSQFIQTNIIGTYNLLEATRDFYATLDNNKKRDFRFLHVSTDEVFGDLDKNGGLFTEESSYNPSSPYSASKASSDHLVRSWGRTYNLPTLITNCSNNYGPYQFTEKFIPRIIFNALRGEKLPVYGNGLQIRDWLYVEDHAEALLNVLKNGKAGDSYNIGGNNEKKNIEVVENICDILESLNIKKPHRTNNFKDLISFVEDRPGHDVRYAIDATKIKDDLGWKPRETFETGIAKTIDWYLNN